MVSVSGQEGFSLCFSDPSGLSEKYEIYPEPILTTFFAAGGEWVSSVFKVICGRKLKY
jgi:hypothetical protein